MKRRNNVLEFGSIVDKNSALHTNFQFQKNVIFNNIVSTNLICNSLKMTDFLLWLKVDCPKKILLSEWLFLYSFIPCKFLSVKILFILSWIILFAIEPLIHISNQTIRWIILNLFNIILESKVWGLIFFSVSGLL